MPEYKKPENLAEYKQNFAEIKPAMTDTEAHYESARCLYCYDAPCVKACPTGIDIPLFIRQIHTGNVTGAAKTIYDANYLGNTCGKVCPTEVLCEGSCVYEKQKMPAVDIGRLQHYATSKVISEEKALFKVGNHVSEARVAVVGAGPAGLSCACELRKIGYEVDVFEARPEPSGLALYGVAPYKLRNAEAIEEAIWLKKQFRFAIYYSQAVANREDLHNLEEGYDAIFLGVGLGSTVIPDIPGSNLEGCIGAVEFIAGLKTKQHEQFVGKKVVVIGGGNTAMDAASEAARMGAEVLLAYRRPKSDMKAYEFEHELTLKAGVKSDFNCRPVAIQGDEKVTGISFTRTGKDTDGKLIDLNETPWIHPCDMVIFATGQKANTDILGMIKGVKTIDRKALKVDPVSYQTANPQYFAGGDAISGGKEVVNAVAEGKAAARGIHNYLQQKEA